MTPSIFLIRTPGMNHSIFNFLPSLNINWVIRNIWFPFCIVTFATSFCLRCNTFNILNLSKLQAPIKLLIHAAGILMMKWKRKCVFDFNHCIPKVLMNPNTNFQQPLIWASDQFQVLRLHKVRVRSSPNVHNLILDVHDQLQTLNEISESQTWVSNLWTDSSIDLTELMCRDDWAIEVSKLVSKLAIKSIFKTCFILGSLILGFGINLASSD